MSDLGIKPPWVLPTGHLDPDDAYFNEDHAYDTGSCSYAMCQEAGHYLELTHSPILCDKIRVFCKHMEADYDEVNPDITVDVYFDGTWHNVISSVISQSGWTVIPLQEPKVVSAMRIKFNKVELYGMIGAACFCVVSDLPSRIREKVQLIKDACAEIERLVKEQ